MAAAKKNLTVRLDDETREKLELVADRELRPLANQLTVFAIQSIQRYMEQERLIFVVYKDTKEMKLMSMGHFLDEYPDLQAGETIIRHSEPPF